MNQYKFKNHTLSSASFLKINKNGQKSNVSELYINLNTNHNLTEYDIDDIDIKSRLEHQLQIQQTKESGWIMDKTSSRKVTFYNTGELNSLR